MSRKSSDWFDAGWMVYKEKESEPDLFPPLGDREAQRQWLGGFGAAWASDLENKRLADDALALKLEGKCKLLWQLHGHKSGETIRTLQ